MTPYCSLTMQGRRRELEVGGGGTADKRKSERSRLVSFYPPRLDGDVPRRVSAEKKKTEREGKEERMWWRRGGRCSALSGGLKTVSTGQRRADKGQKGPNLPYL